MMHDDLRVILYALIWLALAFTVSGCARSEIDTAVHVRKFVQAGSESCPVCGEGATQNEWRKHTCKNCKWQWVPVLEVEKWEAE